MIKWTHTLKQFPLTGTDELEGNVVMILKWAEIKDCFLMYYLLSANSWSQLLRAHNVVFK